MVCENGRPLRLGKHPPPPWTTQTKRYWFLTPFGSLGRFYKPGKSKADGGFFMKESQVKGLTPEQIGVKFQLGYTPTHMAELILPKDFDMYLAYVARHPNSPSSSGAPAMQYIAKDWVRKVMSEGESNFNLHLEIY
jgi:hypothetical protein